MKTRIYLIRIVFLLFICCGIAFCVSGKQVDLQTAAKAAYYFFQSKNANTFDTKLAIIKSVRISGKTVPVFYVFNLRDSGYVIISADNNVSPIIAWSKESRFDTSQIPPNAAEWLKNYETQIAYVLSHNLPASSETQTRWEMLLENKLSSLNAKTTSVSPLTKTAWNQNAYFNAYCPYDSTHHKHTLTGCVATVMSQIMKFWKWPAYGIGYHSYKDSIYGTQSVNFGTTNYLWSDMPNSTIMFNAPIATIMYHTGVSVNMDYGVGSSSSFVLSNNCPILYNAQYSLVKFFGYKSSLHGLYRKDYTDAAWLAVIENELLSGRPLIYDGSNDSEGHSFIADGFDNSGNIHFNWGWGGSFNGYFSISNIVPDSINFMGGNEILLGIEPDTARMLVNGYVLPSPTKIYEGKPFLLNAKVINVNRNVYVGNVTGVLTNDVYPAVTDSQATTIIAISNNDSVTLSLLYYGQPAGNYHLVLYYDNGSGELLPVSDGPNCSNNIPIAIFGDSTTNQFNVYPNPSTGDVIIVLNNSMATAYRLLDESGRALQTGNIDNSSPIATISLNYIQNGTYIIELQTPSGKQYQKVLFMK